ncbi:mechanosensitive ion channel [Candidatus Woesearchaeota archaeon]|nr:mechanosensitive ion channel [Candidatus Woesearchaeota archaeon]
MVNEVIQTAQSYFYDITLGVAILFIGFALGIIVRKVVFKVLKGAELNKVVVKIGIRHDLEKWISSLASFIIYLITIIFFLRYLNITSIVIYLVVGAVLMLLILTFLVGLKDIIPNFVAWVVIQKRELIREGRKIEVREISGVVEKIGYLETEIKTENGDTLYVPNSLFLKSKTRVKKE